MRRRTDSAREPGVTWPRFGLDAGRLLRVVGLDNRIDVSDGSGVETVEVDGPVEGR